jgi:ribose 5-phosphate isomerase B
MITVAIASDHGGYELKEMIAGFLESMDYRVMDLGTNSPESVDYPEYGKKCAEAVASGQADRGIVVCGSGIGISIAANKVKGIRCALCTSLEMAELSRRHNDANMLALGGRTTEITLALNIVKKWLVTPFDGDRHERRVNQLNEM